MPHLNEKTKRKTRMSIQETESVLNSVLLRVASASTTNEVLQVELNALGSVLQNTLQSEHLRRELSQSSLIWRLIRANFEVKLIADGCLSLRIRLVRGVIVLGRNLLSMDRELAESVEIRPVLFLYMDQLEMLGDVVDVQLFENTVVSAFQLLSNLTVNKASHERSLLHELTALFGRKRSEWSPEVRFTVWSYLNNVFDDSDLLYEALSKGKGHLIMVDLLQRFEELDLKNDLDKNGLLLVKIFSKLIVHESFYKFTYTYNERPVEVRFLQVAQALITSKKSWEVFELTVILSWTWELFGKCLLQIQEYFAAKSTKEPTILYEKTLMAMDCISSLVQFEHAQKFLLSYKGVQTLVSLLGTLHQNIKPKKLKDSEQGTELVKEPRNFPHIKSMIIETLSALVYKNFEVQELMREVHGLELVLSHCIIDDNEPFIKERSIVCLRFLLLNNDKNQEFVAKMEAKETVQDDTLDKAGYEVEIVDGKVKLKERVKLEEVHER